MYEKITNMLITIIVKKTLCNKKIFPIKLLAYLYSRTFYVRKKLVTFNQENYIAPGPAAFAIPQHNLALICLFYNNKVYF